jgi:4-hydroxy-tetrahydrodipicolinate reductase
MLNIAVLGAGRMASSIIRVIESDDRCQVSSVWATNPDKINDFKSAFDSAEFQISDDLASVLDGADIAIDFTLAAANALVIENVVAAGIPLVCGVSGLDDAQKTALSRVSEHIPLLYDRNMSYGIAVLTRMLQDIGPALSSGFKTEIHETHHRHKKDAPSGTAMLLGEVLAEGRGSKLGDLFFYDPDGASAKDPGSISFFATREGEIPGDHHVIFRGASETIELSHRVADRQVFAEGAVKAAHWLAGQPKGHYRMLDVLAGDAESAGAGTPA